MFCIQRCVNCFNLDILCYGNSITGNSQGQTSQVPTVVVNQKFGNHEANYPLDFGPRVFIINSKVIKHQLLDVLKKKYK